MGLLPWYFSLYAKWGYQVLLNSKRIKVNKRFRNSPAGGMVMQLLAPSHLCWTHLLTTERGLGMNTGLMNAFLLILSGLT